MGNQDPLAPECVAAQRTAVLDFITHALFREPENPMPNNLTPNNLTPNKATER
jgi:hypothetical protein